MDIYSSEYDVVIAGGGPAGTAAAIAAARNGAKTLIVERCGFLGGMATNASIPVFCPFSDEEKVVIRGVGLEILEKMKLDIWRNPYEENNLVNELDWVAIDAEVLKTVLDNMIAECGCNVLLHSCVTGVEAKNGRINFINVANKGGVHRLKAKIFIDCTGDADLVAAAGGKFEYGDDKGFVQGVTLCFRMANVNGRKYLEWAREVGQTGGSLMVAVKKARENNDFPFLERAVATFKLQHWSIAGLNFGHIFEVNPLKAEDLTRAEIESRKLIPKLIRFLKEYVPGMEDSILASSGPYIGIRESRRITGKYRLTVKDYYNRAEFEDNIARYSYPIDIHATTPEEVVLDDSKNVYLTSGYKPGESYGIPYRTLLPKDLKNVIVAGRSISCDRAMHGSLRVMPCCFATGQAAGTAAALCAGCDLLPEDINIEHLQNVLRKQGAYL